MFQRIPLIHLALGLSLLGLLLSTSGCNRYARKVKLEYQETHNCRWVRVRGIGNDKYRASGCGYEQVYTCRHRRCSQSGRSRAVGHVTSVSVNVTRSLPEALPLSAPTSTTKPRYEIIASQGTLNTIKITLFKQRRGHLIQIRRQGPKRLFANCRGARITAPGKSPKSGPILTTRVGATPLGRGRFKEAFNIEVTPDALKTLALSGSPTLHMCADHHAISADFSASVAKTLKLSVSTTLDLGSSVRATLTAFPGESGDGVSLTLSIPNPDNQATQCKIAILTNGEVMQVGPFAYSSQGTTDRYRATIPIERIAEMVERTRTVGKICDLRFEFDDEDRSQAALFLMKLKEERTFAETPEVEGEADPTLAPAGSTAL